MNIVNRVEITQKTLDKYRGKPFEWGKRDCLRMARTQLIGAGYKVPRIPNYSSAKTAFRRLREAGFESIEDMLANYCLDIPSSLILPGDLATVRGDNELSAIVISTGGKFIGFPSEQPFCCVVDVIPERVFRV